MGPVDDERRDDDVRPPVLRWRDGLRLHALFSVIGLLLLPASFLLVAWMVAGQGYRIGLDLVKPERATVVSTEYNSGGKRSCSGVWIHVRSASGPGKFRVCGDDPRADLAIGETLIVRPLPFFDEVSPDGESFDWKLVILMPIFLLVGISSTLSLVGLWRLTTIGPQGPRFRCRTTQLGTKGRDATLNVIGEDCYLSISYGSKEPGRLRLVHGDVDVWAVSARRSKPSRSRQWVIVQDDRRQLIAGRMDCRAGSEQGRRSDHG